MERKPPVMDWESTNLPETRRKSQQHAQLNFGVPLYSKENEKMFLLTFVGQRQRKGYS